MKKAACFAAAILPVFAAVVSRVAGRAAAVFVALAASPFAFAASELSKDGRIFFSMVFGFVFALFPLFYAHEKKQYYGVLWVSAGLGLLHGILIAHLPKSYLLSGAGLIYIFYPLNMYLISAWVCWAGCMFWAFSGEKLDRIQKCPDCMADISADASVCMHCRCRIGRARKLAEELHAAAADNYAHQIKHLIAQGVNVNATDNNGAAALHCAAANNAGEAAEVLLNNGANIHAKDNDGDTALHVAEDNNAKLVAEMLRKYGAK